ncbi:MAG: MOSC domain-containing protein [Candidatus Geothermarchaeales archaeon]
MVSLWRYPLKSMQGEELNASDVTERGLFGDRVYALLDRFSGKVVSAKNPRKWGRLFDFRAVFVESPRPGQPIPPVRISLPDGTLVTSDQEGIESLLSEVLGRQVGLVSTAPEKPTLEEYWPDIEGLAHRRKVTDEAMPPHTFFDLAVIHISTNATIDRLRELYPEGRFEVRRFRPNIVVQTAPEEKDFVENGWIGHGLAIGEEVRLRVTGPCPRCVMTTIPQSDLPRDPGILRTAARHNQANVGVYASVLRSGTIRRGDPVQLD